MYELFLCDYQDRTEDIQRVRYRVFVDEQGVPEALEIDELEDDCLHAVIYTENKAVATARLTPDGHIGRVAVLQEYRGQKLGQRLMHALEQQAEKRGHTRVEISAQIQAQPFYAALGYEAYGEVYPDAGIPHQAMQKPLKADDKPLINLDELSYTTQTHGEHFEAHLASVAAQIGGKKLGYRMVILPPGKRAWPKHAHLVNEEMFFILEGEGTLFQGDKSYPLRSGDIINCPASPELAHTVENTGTTDMKYLAVSTMLEPDVVLYPDSNKFGVLAGIAPGQQDGKASFQLFAKRDCGTDYWADE